MIGGGTRGCGDGGAGAIVVTVVALLVYSGSKQGGRSWIVLGWQVCWWN